jgi:hypothetical protein
MFLSGYSRIAWLIALCANFSSGLEAQPLHRLDLDNGISVAYPSTWSVLPKRFRNTTELVATAGRADVTAPVARTVLTSERQTDNAAAVRRLADIAAEVASPVEYRVIGGWPALERRYVARLGREGQRASGAAEDLADRITTAIAAGDVLVRLETTLLSDANNALGRELQVRAADQAIALGRSALAPMQGVVEEAQRIIERLRSNQRALPPRLPEGGALATPRRLATPRTTSSVAVPLEFGELEIAVSQNGQNVVIAANSGYAYSHDFGATFTAAPVPVPFKHRGDPSVTVGKSGAFYVGYVGLPDGSVAAGGASGCSTAISKSVDNGMTFNFLSHAALCPKTGTSLCFPDQAHIAADRINAGSGGADQLYSVYRNCLGEGSPSTCEDTLRRCRGQPSIVCSVDGGLNWNIAEHIETSSNADFPRMAVAQDGVVYVVFRNANHLQLAKYSSCDSGLVKLGTTITIPTGDTRACPDDQLFEMCHCPVAGLDRCNNGNILSSPTIAVDDTDPSRIYVAFSRNSSDDNEDIVVMASPDRGESWLEVTISNASVGRRFMPWVCSLNGRAYVMWYDRRAATPANNDLTDYYLGSASIEAGTLRAGAEINLSGNPDQQCGAPDLRDPPNWPTAPRSKHDSGACSRQPQRAGICLNTGARCDLNCGPTDSCPDHCASDDVCDTGKGHPNYGDYNGNACSAGSIFAAWASATPSTGLSTPPPPISRIRIYATVIPGQSPP